MTKPTEPKEPSQVEAKRTFTAMKLDIMNGVNGDPSVTNPRSLKVAVAILMHLNERTGTASPADRTLADETGMSVTAVFRARRELRERGWLTWKRTRSSSVYRFSTAKVNGVLDLLISRREARADERADRRNRDRSNVTYLKPRDRSEVTGLDRSGATDKHLKRDTLKVRGKPLKEDSARKVSLLREGTQ